jgi:hypothetical protein
MMCTEQMLGRLEWYAREVMRLEQQRDELLAALKEIVGLEHSPMNFGTARTIARAAIAKAEE